MTPVDIFNESKISSTASPTMIRGRFFRRWGLATIIMCCFVYTAVYISTFQTFEVSVNLEKPRKNMPAPFPWEQPESLQTNDETEKFSNRAIRGHADTLPNNITQRINPDEDAQKNGNEDTRPKVEEEEDDFMSNQGEVNRHRQEVMDERCSKHPELSHGALTDNTYRHIYVNDKHKILYCFIPKVGCSNWKRVMMILNGSTKKISEISSNEVHFTNGMKRLAGFSHSERQQKLRTYKKFMYARNPFVRVLSAFNNKYGDVVQYRKETYFQGFAKTIMKKFRPHATARELKTGENITWTEFVKFLTQNQRPFFDDHWEEMYKICSPCKIQYDFIGHLETVSEDARYMLTKLQLDSLVQFPSRSNSHPTNSTAEFEQAFRNLPRDNLLKLWRIYEKDFELFDYLKPDFISKL